MNLKKAVDIFFWLLAAVLTLMAVTNPAKPSPLWLAGLVILSAYGIIACRPENKKQAIVLTGIVVLLVIFLLVF